MGTGGIALSTTIAAILHFMLLTFFLRKRLNGLEGVRTLKTVGRVLVAAILMAAVCYGIRLGGSRFLGSWQLQDGDFKNAGELATRLRAGDMPVSSHIYSQLSPETRRMIADYQSTGWRDEDVDHALVSDLNGILKGPSIYSETAFGKVPEEQNTASSIISSVKAFVKKAFGKAGLPEEAWALIRKNPQGDELIHLNRLLLVAAYPSRITDGDAKEHWLLAEKHIDDYQKLALQLANYQKPMSTYLMSRLSPRTRQLIAPVTMPYALMHDLNTVIKGDTVYNPEDFANVSLPSRLVTELSRPHTSRQNVRLNRLLLQAVYPNEILKRPIDRVESTKGSFFTVLAAMIIGGLVYFRLLKLLKVNELDFLWDALRRRIYRRPNGGGSPPVSVIETEP